MHHPPFQPRLLGQNPAPLNMPLVPRHASNKTPLLTRDRPRRSTDPTPDIQHLHPFFDPHEAREHGIVLVHASLDALAGGDGTVVEGLAPEVLVDGGDEVVVVVGDLAGVGGAGGAVLRGMRPAALQLVLPVRVVGVGHLLELVGLRDVRVVVRVLGAFVFRAYRTGGGGGGGVGRGTGCFGHGGWNGLGVAMEVEKAGSADDGVRDLSNRRAESGLADQ